MDDNNNVMTTRVSDQKLTNCDLELMRSYIVHVYTS